MCDTAWTSIISHDHIRDEDLLPAIDTLQRPRMPTQKCRRFSLEPRTLSQKPDRHRRLIAKSGTGLSVSSETTSRCYHLCRSSSTWCSCCSTVSIKYAFRRTEKAQSTLANVMVNSSFFRNKGEHSNVMVLLDLHEVAREVDI
jgi:hypothetical protein